MRPRRGSSFTDNTTYRRSALEAESHECSLQDVKEQPVRHISDRVDVFDDDPISAIQLDFPVQVTDYVHVKLRVVVGKLVAIRVRHPLSSRDAAVAGTILELVCS